MDSIKYWARWREELVASSSEGTLIFDFAMGTENVYFPDESCWLKIAPEWAKQKWTLYRDTCELWCKENRIPMTVTNNTRFYEEK